MFKKLFTSIGRFLASEHIRILERRVNETDQRVAQIISQMDPFEPLMKQFHGVFAHEFEHPEENLNVQGQMMMMQLGYQLRDDPSFKFLTDWIMNSQGNETLKRAPVTTDRILYGRAQLSTMLLFVKEVGRLASLYEEELEKRKGITFNSETTVE